MQSTKSIVFFTKECNYTSRKERMHYWVELDEYHVARFYRKGLLPTPFYTEHIHHATDETHLKNYLKILLKAWMLVEDN